MPNYQLETFIDRREAIALFDYLRGRNPDKPWPLLPILTFIAPGGSGKSILIEYLRAKRCCLPDGRAVIPYAHIDFTVAGELKTLLSVLTTLRNELQQHHDGQGQHLTFPRFDLGAAIALSTSVDGNLPLLDQNMVRRTITTSLPFFGPLGEMGNALGNLVPIIPPLLVGLKWVGQLSPLQTLLQRLENSPGWQWYRQQHTAIGLAADARIQDVLLRLYHLSIPGKPEREYLVEQLLPAAFLADLRDALESSPPRAWSRTANVVLFLDGFEALWESSSVTAIRLLEMLALSGHRRRGETDPLLLVIGSRQRLFDFRDTEQQLEQHPSLEQQTKEQSELLAKEHAQERYRRWYQRLPADKRYLRLSDLSLPVWLHDFGKDDTNSYLSLIDNQEQTGILTNGILVETIHRITHGHPLYLALAAAAVVEAQAHSRTLVVSEFQREAVSPIVVLGHEHESIEAYLLDLFLRQLSELERRELVFCAAPRTLDIPTLRAILQLSTDIEANDRWYRYRRLTFARAIDNKKIILHPVVRDLLLKRLVPSRDPDSDYYCIHHRLQEHFHKRTNKQFSPGTYEGTDWYTQIEEAYHALALGNPNLAISLGVSAQQSNLTAWEPLLEAVAQVPTDLIPPDIEKQASDISSFAEHHHSLEDVVATVVLCTWLLPSSQHVPLESARLQWRLGNAYLSLLGGNRQANVEKAISYYQAAFECYTSNAFPVEWARIQNNLGLAFRSRIHGNWGDNLEEAIACFNTALRVFTFETMPYEWAQTWQNRGVGYLDRIYGDWKNNLEEAIACFNTALRVFTFETTPYEWATTLSSLGIAYHQRILGDRSHNLEEAIACFNAASQVFTPASFIYEWATTCRARGNVYLGRAQGYKVDNLEHALTDFNTALEVFRQSSFPHEWAATLVARGKLYTERIHGNKADNLEQALADFNTAFQVFTREVLPREWANTHMARGKLYTERICGNRLDNLEQALADFNAALQLFTREAAPREWATAHVARGKVYAERVCGNKLEDLEQALADFNAALEIHTPDALPRECRDTWLQRAFVMQKLQRWEEAHGALRVALDITNLFLEAAITNKGRMDLLGEIADYDIYLRDAQALLQLEPPYLEGAVQLLEEGRAQNLRATLALDSINLKTITDSSALARANTFVRARNDWHDLEQQMVKLLSEEQKHPRRIAEIENHQQLLQSAYTTFIQARDAIRQYDDPDFLFPSATLGDIGHAVTSQQEALVYLAAGDESGTALIITREGTDTPRIQHLCLPQLTKKAIAELLETTVEQTMQTPDGPVKINLLTGGLEPGRRSKVLEHLQFWGASLSEVAQKLPQGCGFQVAASQLIHDWSDDLERQKLLDHPFDTLSPSEATALETVFSWRLLSLELVQILHCLGNLGLSEIAQLLQARGIRDTTIIPYGQLSLFPLPSVSITSPDGQERALNILFRITIAPSARAAEVSHQRAIHLDSTTRQQILLAGNPQPLPEGVANLPFAEAESDTVRRIAMYLGYQSTILLREKVTKERVIAELEHAWYAHLALHGEYRMDNPMYSRLVLAGDMSVPELQRSLYLSEVLEGKVNLAGLRLLVLSGCESAIIDIRSLPDEMLSLATGFLQAGSAGVIAALWAVDDQATYLLMSRFAQLYLDPQLNLTPTAALAQAQRWLREEVTNRVLSRYDPTFPPPGGTQRSEVSVLRGLRYTHHEALDTIHLRTRSNGDPDHLPYTDPIYWAAFVVVGC